MPPAPVLFPLIVDAVMLSVPPFAMPPPPALFTYWNLNWLVSNCQLPLPPLPPTPPVPAPLTRRGQCRARALRSAVRRPTPPTPVKLSLMVVVVIVALPRFKIPPPLPL